MWLKTKTGEGKEGNKMKTIGIILVLCLGVLLAISYGIAWAAEDSDVTTSGVSLTVPEVCKLIITSVDSSKVLTADGTAETAFDAGYVDLDANTPTLKVHANKKWKFTAKSSGFAAVGTYTKAIGDLQLKDAGAAHVTMVIFTSLSATDQEVATHTAGVNLEDHPCQYRVLLDYTRDIPGPYTATVTYTLATQAL